MLMINNDRFGIARGLLCIAILVLSQRPHLMAQGRYATSDNHSGYVHWIELVDENNTKIDPTAEFPKPYSPEKTCGRCHEFDTIAHGWHFNAVDPQSDAGRSGQPWIWSDPRTGTHLPLSYRGWNGTYDPDVLGLTRWEVAAKLGGYLPGGGPGAKASLVDASASEQRNQSGADTDETVGEDRSAITGELPVDCLMCHRNEGSGYSPFAWTEQVENQNFAYAPTIALGIAEVNGSMSRLKQFDPSDADAASKLPKLTYQTERFRSDGKVFIDLVRKPQNNACYYCHTNVTADTLTGQRWLHDEDIHLRAGMQCADCHRNGLDHQTVRGFSGERHPGGASIASLSCQGCHVGSESTHSGSLAGDPLAQAGRLGAPNPAHRGLPPLHFEKLSCTACHSGPAPQQEVPRLINSIAHHLGEHVKRTGDEFPAIYGPVNLPLSTAGIADPNHDHAAASESAAGNTAGSSAGTLTGSFAGSFTSEQAKYTPQRLLWPSFWGTIEAGEVTPLNPQLAYELVRKPLKVRKDFTQELYEVSLSLSERKELLGDDRARVKDDQRTPEEQGKVASAEKAARAVQLEERVGGALAAIEERFPGKQAVYLTAGSGWVRYGEAKLKALPAEELGQAAQPYTWPLAHNVRPARQSLGAEGCLQCHSDNSTFFFADVTPASLIPEQVLPAIKVVELQGTDVQQLKNWNQLFAGRASFKIASLVALAATCLLTLSALAWNIGAYWQRKA